MGQQCPFCPKQFALASKLQCHLLTHTGQKTYSCVLCSRDFYQSAHLKRHLETHSNLSPIARHDDDEVDLYLQPNAPQELSVSNSHLLESSNDNYSGCLHHNEQVEMAESLNTPDHWNISRWNYTEVFTESKNVKEKNVSASRNLSKQPRQGTVARSKPHQCLVCSKYFGSPYKLRRHQLTHTGERPFKCASCDKAFRQLSHLKLHSQSHCRRNSVENPGVVSDHPKSPTQCASGLSAEVYPSQLHGMTVISSPTHADVPEFAKLPHITHADISPPDIWEQAYGKPHFMVESPYEIKQVNEQHLTSALQVKASYACNNIPSLGQAMVCKLSNYKDKESRISPPKKLDQSISEVGVHRNLNDNNPMVPSYVSKLSKPHDLLDPGQEERSSHKDTYECQTCFKSFSVPSKLHRHMLTHTGQRPFACHICAKSFRQLCHLKLHLRTGVCLKQPSKPVKKKVRNMSRKFPRDSGPLTTVSNMYAQKYVNDCTTTAQNFSSLSTCVPAFSEADGVRGKPSDLNMPTSHHVECHSQDGSKATDQTSKKSCSYLSEPVNVNGCRIVHECPVCFKCFSSPSKLKRHCLIHTGQRPFQCYMCQRAFRQLAHLKVHYRVHERSGRKTPSLQRQGLKNHLSRAPTPRPKAFTCNQCGWKFRHQTHLTVHLQNHKSSVGATPDSIITKTSGRQNEMSSKVHRSYEPTNELVPEQSMCVGRTNLDNTPGKTQSDSMASNISSQKQSRHCCSVCFKCFDSPSRLHRHSLNHSGLKPFKCLSCCKTFRQRAHLKVHRCLSKEGTQLEMHMEDSNMNCNEVLDGQSQFAKSCYPAKEDSLALVNPVPMQESSSQDQVGRYASLDFGEGKRQTPILPKPTYLPHKGTLKPSKQKGYPCTICQRHFSVPSKLARHLLIHMGIKPFTCEVCGRSFRQSCHLQTHLNIHQKKKVSGVLSSSKHGWQSTASTSVPPSAPRNSALLKENTVTKQNLIQKNQPQSHSLDCLGTVKKAGKSEPLHPSKSNQSLDQTDSDVRYVEKTINQWHGNTLSQSHSTPSGCETSRGSGEIFSVREVNNYAPEFTNMHPIPHRVQSSDANAFPENQIFIDLSCDDTTTQPRHPSCSSEQAYRKLATAQKLIRKKANCCSICLKKFDSPSKLARHFLIHMGLKPFKCQVCSKSFRQLCHLQTHKKVHRSAQNMASDGTQSQPQPTSGDVESTSNGHVFDVALHQSNASQDLHFPEIEQSHYKDHNENNQPLVSLANEYGHSEIKNSNYGFADVNNQKQEGNDFMVQPLIQPLSAQNKQNFTNSQQNIPRVFSSQLPQHTHDSLEIQHNGLSPACPAYGVANSTLESTRKVRKAETYHTPYLDYLVERGGGSRDGGQGLAEVSCVPGSPPAHGQLKEEISELQFEMEGGVDSRLSKPPKDLLICPGCSQCFSTERKLNLHKCDSRQAEEREKPKSGYQCAICFKSFQVPSKLKRHYVIHTGHRPFQCSVCSKTFTQSGHLKTHLQTHK